MNEGWIYKKVKEVCDKASSTIVLNKIGDNTGDYPLFGASGFVKGVDFYHRDKPYIGIVKDGAGVGRVKAYPAKSSLVGTMQYILPKDNILLPYLCYALQGLNLAKLVSGATIPHIYFKDYGEFSIPVPPIETQQHIVSELDLLQSIIDKQKAQLKELDNLAKAVFYDMFGDPVRNEKGFPVLSVDDVIEFQGGSQPDKSHFEYEPTENNIRLIQIRDYRTNQYITYIPKSLAKRFCTKDDIMIGRYGPPIFQILKGIEGSYNVALMKAVPKMGNREFIRAFLKQECLLHFLEGHSKRTAGQDGIQMDKLKAYPFPYPPISLQESFAARNDSIEKQKSTISKSLEETQNLFDYTMDKYFG